MNSSVIVGILLVVLVLSLLFRWRQKSKEKSFQPNHGFAAAEASVSADAKQGIAISGANANGLEKIRREDPSFDENLFKEHASAFFFQFQAAQTKRNISEMRRQMTEEMFAALKAKEDKQEAEGKFHKIENISIQSVELTHAWQDNGHDFIKVKYLTDFMDRCIEENSEEQGCDAPGQKIDYSQEWLFSRISGKNPWYLSGIEPA